ncbi:MAG: Hint domain-containing protein [Pseudomonadota bacterium]
MARISELHYSNAYARSTGVGEFLEVALKSTDDPADFVVGFYQADGSLGIEVRLDDPRVVRSVDPENGEVIFVLSEDNLPIRLTDPDGGGATNYEGYALTDTSTGTVLDFYDIGGGTQNIQAQSGAAAGAVSENLTVLTGPNSTTTTIQFNQPNPDVQTNEALSPGDTGLACFVAGTLIETPTGPRPVETLRQGDLVWTADQSAQPLCWIGQQTVAGSGTFAPVRFAPGRFEVEAPVLVSPQHRVLVRGWQAQLFFGAEEVLVPAKALIDGQYVTQVSRPRVTYVHLLFEDHQIVRSHGLLSESYDPASLATSVWARETEAELMSLFPQFQRFAFGRTARQTQTVREGAVLRA